MNLFMLMAVLCAATGTNPVVEVIEDSAITGQVESLFAVNPHLSPFNINTTTVDGIVTLTGGVGAQAQKQLAEDLARSVKGVKNVKNDLSIIATVIGEKEKRGWRQKARDKGIEAAVRARLVGKGQFQGLHIGVECVNGEITLYGVVHTEALKAKIGSIANETQGVERVFNHLTVRPRDPRDPIQGIGQQFTDEWLEGRVETAILLNHYLSIRELDVEVDDGVCILTGSVNSEAEKTLAGSLAASIQGVTKVRNEIQVRTPPVELKGSDPKEDDSAPQPAAKVEEKRLPAP